MKLALLLVAAMMIAGCTATEEGAMKKDSSMMENNVSGSTGYTGKILAGSSAPLIDYNKEDYDKASGSGKVVLLYFYATWCPICRAELPELYAAFNELTTYRVIGFRVNYNDGDTDADESALAQQYQVPYQHTKVIIKDGKATKYPDGWNRQRYLAEINKVIG